MPAAATSPWRRRRLPGFDLLPRIKRINQVKLYRPDRAAPDAYPALGPAMTRPIRWEVIEENYDQMIKYATAIRRRSWVRRSQGGCPAVAGWAGWPSAWPLATPRPALAQQADVGGAPQT